MINNEDIIRAILWCTENCESAAKAIISDYEKIDRDEISEDSIGYYVDNLKKCADRILFEIGLVHNDRVGIESALPDDPPTKGDEVLFKHCIAVVSETIRAKGVV